MPVDEQCRRCQNSRSTELVRGEYLCAACLGRWIATKVVKRIEASRIRSTYGLPARRILLPLSFGLSSVCLLHQLHAHLQSRLCLGRQPGFSLHLLHVDLASVGIPSGPIALESFQQRYPQYPLERIGLEECFAYGIEMEPSQPDQDAGCRLKRMLAATTSVTSEVDVIEILLRRLICAFARARGHSAVLYGDSTTRLAERTLAETAKGRGDAVSAMTTDGSSEGLLIAYPLRDVLRSELQLLVDWQNPELKEMIQVEDQTVQSVSSKNLSIDALMRQYFASVETPYPSIVANVVRTTSKLKQPMTSDRLCDCCVQPIVPSNWAGNQGGEVTTEMGTLCYGCRRSLQR